MDLCTLPPLLTPAQAGCLLEEDRKAGGFEVGWGGSTSREESGREKLWDAGRRERGFPLGLLAWLCPNLTGGCEDLGCCTFMYLELKESLLLSSESGLT